MNHQLFESWLLEPENLESEQRQELAEHLKNCPTCRHIQYGLASLDTLLTQPAQVAPPSGFTQRFQASLESRRKQRRAQQIRLGVYIFSGAIITTAFGFMIHLLSNYSVARILATLIEVTTNTPQRVIEFRYMISFWLNQVPEPLVATISILMASWIFVLLIPWALTFIRFNRQGVIQK